MALQYHSKPSKVDLILTIEMRKWSRFRWKEKDFRLQVWKRKSTIWDQYLFHQLRVTNSQLMPPLLKWGRHLPQISISLKYLRTLMSLAWIEDITTKAEFNKEIRLAHSQVLALTITWSQIRAQVRMRKVLTWDCSSKIIKIMESLNQDSICRHLGSSPTVKDR